MPEGRKRTTLWKTALSILTVIVGAYLSFMYGQETNRRKMLGDQRASAYVQYVEASALYSQLSSKKEDLKAAEQRGLINAARFRMVIYGSKDVLESLALVEGEKRGSREWGEATLKWFQAMRKEIVPEGEHVSDEIIRVVLWPPKSEERVRNLSDSSGSGVEIKNTEQ